MTKAGRAVEEQHMKALQELRRDDEAEMDALSKQASLDVRRSAQAAKVRRLQTQLAVAECQLRTMQSRRADELAEEAEGVQADHWDRHDTLLHARVHERAKLRKRSVAAAAHCRPGGGMCASPECGKFFDAGKTPVRRRCGWRAANRFNTSVVAGSRRVAAATCQSASSIKSCTTAIAERARNPVAATAMTAPQVRISC